MEVEENYQVRPVHEFCWVNHDRGGRTTLPRHVNFRMEAIIKGIPIYQRDIEL
jgi:hypothetical protein